MSEYRPATQLRDARPPLLELAHVPVLAVGHVPELDRLLGIEAVQRDRVGLEQPVADDGRATGAERHEPVDEQVVRVDRQEGVAATGRSSRSAARRPA